MRNDNILCHEHVVHAEDVDLVNAPRLELVVLFDVSRCLRMTRGREGSRHTNLPRSRIIYHYWLSDKAKTGGWGRGAYIQYSINGTHKQVLARGRERNRLGGVRLLDGFC